MSRDRFLVGESSGGFGCFRFMCIFSGADPLHSLLCEVRHEKATGLDSPHFGGDVPYFVKVFR